MRREPGGGGRRRQLRRAGGAPSCQLRQEGVARRSRGVSAGEHVDEGTPIYVIATEKVEQEIEAGASGTVQGTGTVGTTYDMGAEIGVITS